LNVVTLFLYLSLGFFNLITKDMNRLKIILAVVFLFSGIQVFAQDASLSGVSDDSLSGVSDDSLSGGSEASLARAPHAMMAMSDLDYEKEILHIRNSLMKYRREKLTGIWLTIGGGLVYGMSVGLYEAEVLDEDGAAVVLITGGLLAISGSILQLTSNRWLKQAYLGPTRSGIGLGLNL
jgi:hypothetical protein